VRLLLVRHGQTPSNVRGLLDTAAPGPGLTELGHRQAAELVEGFAGMPVDGIFASSLVRTRLTAAPLALDRGLEPIQLPGTHEIGAGRLEMRSDHASVRTYLHTAFSWGRGELDGRMPGGENGHEFFERYDESIRRVARSEGASVVVSHGAAIRVWVARRATNVPASYAGDHELDNTGVVELEGSPEAGWRLIAWQGTPVGGAQLVDATAEDPTGETLEEALD
jgi:broad specificity phosphatase PhoE